MTPYKRSILQALLDGKTIQATVVEGNWEDIPENAVLSEVWNWDLPFPLRIKPNTIKIGDTEVPEPLREAPDTGTGYYVVSIGSASFYFYDTWDAHPLECRALDRGLIHLTAEAAIQHAKALIALSEK